MLMIDADTFVDGLRADLAYRLARMRGIDLARDMARHGSDAANILRRYDVLQMTEDDDDEVAP